MNVSRLQTNGSFYAMTTQLLLSNSVNMSTLSFIEISFSSSNPVIFVYNQYIFLSIHQSQQQSQQQSTIRHLHPFFSSSIASIIAIVILMLFYLIHLSAPMTQVLELYQTLLIHNHVLGLSSFARLAFTKIHEFLLIFITIDAAENRCSGGPPINQEKEEKSARNRAKRG